MRALVDTSVLIARERAVPGAEPPDESAISVLTLAELHLGVLLADDPAVRAARLKTLSEVERVYPVLPIDTPVAQEFAAIVAKGRYGGRPPRLFDALIAATAARHGVPVYVARRRPTTPR